MLSLAGAGDIVLGTGSCLFHKGERVANPPQKNQVLMTLNTLLGSELFSNRRGEHSRGLFSAVSVDLGDIVVDCFHQYL